MPVSLYVSSHDGHGMGSEQVAQRALRKLGSRRNAFLCLPALIALRRRLVMPVMKQYPIKTGSIEAWLTCCLTCEFGNA